MASSARLVNPNAEVVAKSQALLVNCSAAKGLMNVLKSNLGKPFFATNEARRCLYSSYTDIGHHSAPASHDSMTCHGRTKGHTENARGGRWADQDHQGWSGVAA